MPGRHFIIAKRCCSPQWARHICVCQARWNNPTISQVFFACCCCVEWVMLSPFYYPLEGWTDILSWFIISSGTFRSLLSSIKIKQLFRPLSTSDSILLSDYGKGLSIFSPLKFLHSIPQSKMDKFLEKSILCGIKHLFAFLCNDFQYHHDLFLISSYGIESESMRCRKWRWGSCGQLGCVMIKETDADTYMALFS